MKTDNLKLYSYILFLVLFHNASAQLSQSLQYPFENFNELKPRKSYPTAIGQQYNITQNFSHPEFGILPYDAPFEKNVVEQIHKRTAYERFYVDRNDPSFFYIQKSSNSINYLKNGNWFMIDPTLENRGNQFFEAPLQPCPTFLDFINKKSGIVCGTYSINCSNLKLKVINTNNTITTLVPNWSNYMVGNNGAIITDIFPGIDLKFVMQIGGIKTNYIIKTPIAGAKSLIFIDSLQLSNGLNLVQQSGFPGQLFVGSININDNTNTTQFTIGKAYTEDSGGGMNNSPISYFNSYRLINNLLELTIDSVFLNNQYLTYPLIVDPLITAVGPVSATSNTIGSDINPLFCSQTLTVTYPGGSTPWDFSASWVVSAGNCCSVAGGCRRAWAFADISSNCGGKTPTGASFWNCPAPLPTSPCASTGLWNPTIAFGSSGCQSMVQCLPASCSSQSIVFTYTLRRGSGTACPSTGGCNCTWATNTCIRLNGWNVTLQGKTMETLGNTTTGNGTSTISVTCFSTAVLNPNVQFGVSPFTYQWAPNGETTGTITYSANFVGSATYTANVTDACGSIRTAIFTVNNNCALPITLKTFNAHFNGKYVILNWETATERNSDLFTIERSTDGVNYFLLGKVKAAGYSIGQRSYHFSDEDPIKDKIMYYRLRTYDKDQLIFNQERLLSIKINEMNRELRIVPNPASEHVNIEVTGIETGEIITMIVFDNIGRIIFNRTYECDSKTFNQLINISNIENGVYYLKIGSTKWVHNGKFTKN